MLSHMNNVFTHNNALQNAKKLGYLEEDSLDLLTAAPNLPIEGYRKAVDEYSAHSMDIGAQFMRVVDHYLRLEGANGDQQINESLENILRRSEVQKFRLLMVPPRPDGSAPEKEKVLWHYDVGFATVMYKNRFFVHDENGKKVIVEDPDDGTGLVVRRRDGQDIAVRLKKDEVAIQGGMSLQILTNNVFKAQAHKVTAPVDPKMGRMSTVHFIYPPLDLTLGPIANSNGKEEPLDFKQLQNILAPNDTDVINAATLCSNHWYKGVKWIEFHQNQMMQFTVVGYIRSLPFQDEVVLNQSTVNVGDAQKQLKVYHFNVVDSTMTIAERWPKQYVSDKISYLFIADSQKSGQGQRTNTWSSPPGNCYVTYLVKLGQDLSIFSA